MPTPHTLSSVQRSALKWEQPALATCLILVFIFTGCAGMQLSQFQKHAARGDHDWIATQAITCQQASDACAKMHLIKGDACFHLAKAGRQPAINYACAADGLEKGLALNPSGADTGTQTYTQENLCESLDNLQAMQSGETAERTLDRFVEAAKALYQLAPKQLPAVYYLSRARLRQITPMLLDINPATRIPVCSRLKRTVSDVLSMMETAKVQRLPDWSRFADNYERLAYDLGAAINAADCR